MKLLKKAALAVFILPLTLLLDLVLFAFLKNCPSCGSFWEFVRTEGALSFPLVVGIINWVENLSLQRKSTMQQ